ncbi:MAG: hypothetical protein H7222_17265, partial [Methylotenera sp.]|nr:hypothetical protein [Oligoflexia bacterium]
MKKNPFKRLANQAAQSTKLLKNLQNLKSTAESLSEAAAPRVKNLKKSLKIGLNEKAHAAQNKVGQLWDVASGATQVLARDVAHQTRKAAKTAVRRASKQLKQQVGGTVNREVVERFKRSARDAVSSLKESGAEFKAYLESDEFEYDLDDLAKRLSKFEGAYENFSGPEVGSQSGTRAGTTSGRKTRLLRVHSKARFLFKECREDVLKQAARKEVIFALPINPKLAAALALIFSGVKTTEIVLHGIDVFAPRKRP